MVLRWGKKPAVYPYREKPSSLRQQVDAIFTQMIAVADELEAEAKTQMEEHRDDH